VWHGAALYGSLRALETLWSWAKEEELNRRIFLAQIGNKLTVFQFAAEKNHVETIQKILVWAEEMPINPKS
jgi:hypothetical protein